ncbi:hypothetical protein PIB30_037116 [Stylosanthes scabra]|uniref:Uncharacterized protein n=1 Tax=Stylosanthes scabra TaxID=79078 RepID=A0ABU6ZAJ2_9FABA|nr:hypothetical protein [Stylosanthes scabra]
MDDIKQTGGKRKPLRKEVIARSFESQKDKISRSLMGVLVNPIDLRRIGERIHECWDSPRLIECRDVGPYRCYLTFESEKIKDEAITRSSLLSIFDEINHIRSFFGVPQGGCVWKRWASRLCCQEVRGDDFSKSPNVTHDPAIEAALISELETMKEREENNDEGDEELEETNAC